MSTPVEEVRLSLPHIELAAHLFGPEDGVPVIALHGWLDNANSFARLAPKLQGLRIVALDMADIPHGPALVPAVYLAEALARNAALEAALCQAVDVLRAAIGQRDALITDCLAEIDRLKVLVDELRMMLGA